MPRTVKTKHTINLPIEQFLELRLDPEYLQFKAGVANQQSAGEATPLKKGAAGRQGEALGISAETRKRLATILRPFFHKFDEE